MTLMYYRRYKSILSILSMVSYVSNSTFYYNLILYTVFTKTVRVNRQYVDIESTFLTIVQDNYGLNVLLLCFLHNKLYRMRILTFLLYHTNMCFFCAYIHYSISQFSIVHPV